MTRNGQVVQQNPNKPEYGSIGFEQTAFVTKNGFLNTRRKVAFLNGTMDELNTYAEVLSLTEGAELPGRLYVREQFTPYYEGQQPKMNPQTGNAILVDGAMIFSKTFYDETGSQPDVYLNGEIAEGGRVAEPRVAVMPSLISSSLS